MTEHIDFWDEMAKRVFHLPRHQIKSIILMTIFTGKITDEFVWSQFVEMISHHPQIIKQIAEA